MNHVSNSNMEPATRIARASETYEVPVLLLNYAGKSFAIRTVQARMAQRLIRLCVPIPCKVPCRRGSIYAHDR